MKHSLHSTTAIYFFLRDEDNITISCFSVHLLACFPPPTLHLEQGSLLNCVLSIPALANLLLQTEQEMKGSLAQSFDTTMPRETYLCLDSPWVVVCMFNASPPTDHFTLDAPISSLFSELLFIWGVCIPSRPIHVKITLKHIFFVSSLPNPPSLSLIGWRQATKFGLACTL